MDDLIKALSIFNKYMKQNGKETESPTNCSHDMLFINCPIELIPEKEVEGLYDLGFVKDTENDGWISFRFGSC